MLKSDIIDPPYIKKNIKECKEKKYKLKLKKV